MSTRSNIIIITPENQAHQFYHHCDGYLSGVGEELRRMLNESENYTDLLPKLATPDEYGDFYRDEGKFDQKLAANGLHADIEFLYIIRNNKLYYMEIWRSKDYKKLRTYKELIDYICISKHEIDLTKKVTNGGYIYEDNKPEDYTTTKTEVKTMNYAEEKTRIESKIKELQEQLETLEKTAKKEEWKNYLIEKFKEILNYSEFSETNGVTFKLQKDYSNEGYSELYTFEGFLNGFNFPTGKTAKVAGKVETTPENETKNAEKPVCEPKTEETNEKPENKIVICSIPKPNETPEEKPVKMKMTLDEFIDSLPEPAEK